MSSLEAFHYYAILRNNIHIGSEGRTAFRRQQRSSTHKVGWVEGGFGPVLKPSPRPEPWCVSYNKKLNKEVAKADANKGFELVFYGDSITETWRGTDMGRPCSRCTGVPAIFQKYFGSKYDSEVLAVGGDQAAHLMWRLLHGQLYVQHQPQVMVVMIGTNDLGAASCRGGEPAIAEAANGAAQRTLDVLRYLREQNRDAQIVALAVLPRGWTDAWHVYDWPSMYKLGIDVINRALKDFAAQDDAVHYLDCGPAVTPGGQIHPELMPDALHPNAAGMELFAQCLSPLVDELMTSSMTLREHSTWRG
ncbi:g3329 [Coccomyxa viridis]|uniref:G3329 protein n=1 Tax=Coccomyxa viridis TaxID=1274662 RepID=A0ABP1FMI8_9CHLO